MSVLGVVVRVSPVHRETVLQRLARTPITVGDALGSPFDLTELMSARPFPQRSDTTTQMFPDTF